MRKFLKKALIGIAISYLITTAYMLAFEVYLYCTSKELIFLYAVWAVFGFFAGTTTMFFDLIENKIYATTCHFITIITLWIIAMNYTIDVDLSIMVIASIQFLLIYIVIYAIEYRYFSKNIETINQNIQKHQK